MPGGIQRMDDAAQSACLPNLYLTILNNLVIVDTLMVVPCGRKR